MSSPPEVSAFGAVRYGLEVPGALPKQPHNRLEQNAQHRIGLAADFSGTEQSVREVTAGPLRLLC
jgi:hypothetical protein